MSGCILNFTPMGFIPTKSMTLNVPLKGRETHILVKGDIGEEDKNSMLTGLIAQLEYLR